MLARDALQGVECVVACAQVVLLLSIVSEALRREHFKRMDAADEE